MLKWVQRRSTAPALASQTAIYFHPRVRTPPTNTSMRKPCLFGGQCPLEQAPTALQSQYST
eukprot:5831857-Lingulodinium_polyedra.AAC.1